MHEIHVYLTLKAELYLLRLASDNRLVNKNKKVVRKFLHFSAL